MFKSATLKLTAWYAGILMIISILFSVAIYEISIHEVDNRLERFQGLIQARTTAATPIMSTDPAARLRIQETDSASDSFIIRLVYINLVILAVGGTASYFLARRTLRPVEEAHETQVRFVSDASHELRTPLAVMKSELEVNLRDPNITKKELREILESNLEEVNDLSRLSETLLAMAKLDHSQLIKEPTKIGELAEKAVARFKQPNKRLSIVKNVPATIMAHHDSITELIIILIDNALKYSPKNSQVTVRVDKKDAVAFVEINNEGEGISEEALDHIFDRFYRADSSRTASDQSGFGLGLSIAKQIAEIHGGIISASSAPKQTTTFTFSIPLTKKI